MSASGMLWPAVTATPLSVSVPAPGSVVIFTARKPFGRIVVGVAEAEVGSANMYRRCLPAWSPCCLVPLGASLTVVTSTVIVLGVGSRSTPPLAVPPLSCTWNVKLAYAVPLALAAGVNVSSPEAMSATRMNCPGVTATPLSVSVPDVGSVVILTARKTSAGVSLGSLKPKSIGMNV